MRGNQKGKCARRQRRMRDAARAFLAARTIAPPGEKRPLSSPPPKKKKSGGETRRGFAKQCLRVQPSFLPHITAILLPFWLRHLLSVQSSSPARKNVEPWRKDTK